MEWERWDKYEMEGRVQEVTAVVYRPLTFTAYIQEKFTTMSQYHSLSEMFIFANQTWISAGLAVCEGECGHAECVNVPAIHAGSTHSSRVT